MTVASPGVWIVLLVAAASVKAQPDSEIEGKVRSLYEAGEWADAARHARETSSRSAQLDLYLGLALARLGSLDDAERAFLEGQRRHPGDARFSLELAGVAYRKQDLNRSKKRLAEALRLDPSSVYGNDFLATLFLMEGNLPAALKYWNRIDKPLIQELRYDPAPPLHALLRDRAFAVSGGQVLTLERLGMTIANLNRLGLFAMHRFDLTPRPDQRFDLTFRSLERRQAAAGRLGRILPFVRGLPYQTVLADLHNLKGRAIHFSFLGRWDAEKRRLAMSLAGPVRMNPGLRYRLSVDLRDEHWDLQTTYFGRPGGLNGLVLRKVEAGAELEFGLTGRLQWTPGLWLARRDFRNGDQTRFFADSWSFQFRNNFLCHLWALPEHRLRVDASGLLRTGRLLTGAPGRVIGMEGSLNTVWFPQPKGDDLAVTARVGAGKMFGAPPFDEFYLLGMERDNDLWLRGHLGTREGRKGRAPSGTHYGLIQTSLDRTILKVPFVRFQMGPFLDIGRIGDPSAAFGSRGWMTDSGLQAKIKALGGLTWTLVYGRDLRHGRGVFYTSVSR